MSSPAARRTSYKASVEEANTLQEYGHDKGLSVFQLHAGQVPNVPPFTSRLDMAYWILRGSPKICWLVNYVNEKKKQGKRVAVFVMWPVTQWLIEAVFELLGFNYVSIRSERL